MSGQQRPELTAEQLHSVDLARQALAAAEAETEWNTGRLAHHVGTLRYELSQMLVLVDQLTGGRGSLDPPQEVLDRMAARGMRELTSQPSAEERPDNGPLHAAVFGVHECGAADGDYICTAAQGHTGPHMAYDAVVTDRTPEPNLCHSWPQESAEDDTGRAIVADLDDQQHGGAE